MRESRLLYVPEQTQEERTQSPIKQGLDEIGQKVGQVPFDVSVNLDWWLG